jgi:hypothetical protein
MVSEIQGSSLLRTVRASQAFKNSVKYSEDTNDIENNSVDSTSSQKALKSQKKEIESSNKTEFTSSLLDYKKDIVDDFKKFVDKIGNFKVDNEDIDYALRYGTSILVDKRA